MTLETIKDSSIKNSSTEITFHQLEIPEMEKFLDNLKAQAKTTRMTLQPSQNILSKNPEAQTSFQQLEIPGMEKFLANLKTESGNIDDFADDTAA